jgi:hypothetical protein
MSWTPIRATISKLLIRGRPSSVWMFSESPESLHRDGMEERDPMYYNIEVFDMDGETLFLENTNLMTGEEAEWTAVKILGRDRRPWRISYSWQGWCLGKSRRRNYVVRSRSEIETGGCH